jgi:transposase
MKAITIGLDIARSVFQVHGETGKIVLQKRLRRSQVLAFFAGLEPALIGIEACGSAHYLGRELRALGHEVRLIPAMLLSVLSLMLQQIDQLRIASARNGQIRPFSATRPSCRQWLFLAP